VPAGDDRLWRADGRKELIALADGLPGSPRSPGRTCCATAAPPGHARSRARPPGDGAPGGSGGAPGARSSRKPANSAGWFHKTANGPGRAAQSPLTRGAKKALAEIWGAEDKQHAPGRGEGRSTPPTVPSSRRPRRRSPMTRRKLLAFYDYPCEPLGASAHDEPDRVDLLRRYGTARKVTKGPGSRGPPGWPWHSSSSSQHKTAGVPSTPPHLVALVRARRDLHQRKNSLNDPARMPSRKQPK